MPLSSEHVLSERIIGEHESIQRLRQLVLKVARSKAGIILIYGETGSGKGLIARTLHELSDRSQHNFTEINCAAIPGNLMESELFGHERGAFTGAVQRKAGLLETAAGGTVFLDEIRELDPVMQAKILTLFDSRHFRRIGSVQELSTDARFIAATNKILLGEVDEGRFRDDLYYRLQVVSINIPPLRDRGDDVFVLADKLLKKLNSLHGSSFTSFSPDVKDIFRRYPWPGNVRELSNLLERICILEEGSAITTDHLPTRIVREANRTSNTTPTEYISAVAGALDDSLHAPLDYATQTAEFQRSLITHTLKQTNGNLAQASALLGLSRHALRHQLLKLGITHS